MATKYFVTIFDAQGVGLWTLTAMTSKNKNGGDSWGTLYGRPMERLAFRYDRHEEIARYFGCGMYTIIQW